jgi:hypothetical protein
VGNLVEVSDLDGGFAGREMRAFTMARGTDDAAFDFQPALQTISGQVTVRFRLSPI